MGQYKKFTNSKRFLNTQGEESIQKSNTFYRSPCLCHITCLTEVSGLNTQREDFTRRTQSITYTASSLACNFLFSLINGEFIRTPKTCLRTNLCGKCLFICLHSLGCVNFLTWKGGHREKPLEALVRRVGPKASQLMVTSP